MSHDRHRWLVRAAILLLVVAVLAIGAIASGVFDPMPWGSLIWQVGPEQITAKSQSREIRWLDQSLPQSALTVRLEGALESGADDSGYGLVLGDETSYWAAAVAPTGYLAIWEWDGMQDNFLLQWQTWPHVRGGNEVNELWVDVTGSQATVRVNREWLWEGEIGPDVEQLGLMGESFAAAAVFEFSNVELFAVEEE
jgi:hypothetical protein